MEENMRRDVGELLAIYERSRIHKYKPQLEKEAERISKAVDACAGGGPAEVLKLTELKTELDNLCLFAAAMMSVEMNKRNFAREKPKPKPKTELVFVQGSIEGMDPDSEVH